MRDDAVAAVNYHFFNSEITGRYFYGLLYGYIWQRFDFNRRRIVPVYKSATEIHHKMEGESGDTSKKIQVTTFASAIGQILILDLVFSIDSIITAVGMVDELWIMYTAVVVSVAIVLFASEPISKFVNNHPAFPDDTEKKQDVT